MPEAMTLPKGLDSEPRQDFMSQLAGARQESQGSKNESGGINLGEKITSFLGKLFNFKKEGENNLKPGEAPKPHFANKSIRLLKIQS